MDFLSRQQQFVLVREKNQERIALNKPVFRIGRERMLADYFIGDNPTISRIHAQIEIKDNVYVITDCNSLNHTYVNGQLLPAGKPLALHSGDVIRLGNEVFTFVVETVYRVDTPAAPEKAKPFFQSQQNQQQTPHHPLQNPSGVSMPIPPKSAPIPPASQPKPAASKGLFSGLRKGKKKAEPAPFVPPMAASSSPSVYSPPAPPPSASFQTGSFGSTVAPPAPAFQANTFDTTTAPATPSIQPAADPVRVDKVQFSAVAPQKATKGEYTIVQLFMYEQAFRSAVDEALEMGEGPMQEKKTGIYQVKDNTRIKVVLSSPDAEILDDTAEETWQGGYLCFDFALDIPQDTPKRQILLKAAVYFDDIPATRLMMTLRLQTQHEQRMEVLRCDVLSAFVSYASQDRSRVGGLIQGMKKARPDMDIFFDVNSLRSGENWEETLRREVERRDILFLCWSKHAKESPWVDMEWRYALQNKGLESIEPIPIDPPDECPPPQELQSKHFNDSLLYIINRP